MWEGSCPGPKPFPTLYGSRKLPLFDVPTNQPSPSLPLILSMTVQLTSTTLTVPPLLPPHFNHPNRPSPPPPRATNFNHPNRPSPPPPTDPLWLFGVGARRRQRRRPACHWAVHNAVCSPGGRRRPGECTACQPPLLQRRQWLGLDLDPGRWSASSRGVYDPSAASAAVLPVVRSRSGYINLDNAPPAGTAVCSPPTAVDDLCSSQMLFGGTKLLTDSLS